MEGCSGPYTEPLDSRIAYATSPNTDMLGHLKLTEVTFAVCLAAAQPKTEHVGPWRLS